MAECVKKSEMAKLDDFYKSYAKKAFSVVLDDFPLKIKQIEQLKKEFSWKQIASLKPDTEWVRSLTRTYFEDNNKIGAGKSNRPVRCIAYSSTKPKLFDVYHNGKAGNGSMIETNGTVHQMINRIKPYLVELSDLTLQLTFAIQLLEPKCQDGNNFGLEVQYKAMTVSNEAYSNAQDFLESFKSYYSNRDRALQLVMCYPHIEDYQLRLAELDISFTYTLCRGVDELYNVYTAIHDVVTKNIDKLLRPRDDVDTKGNDKLSSSPK